MPTDKLRLIAAASLFAGIITATGTLATGCSGGADVSADPDVLVAIGSETLRTPELRKAVPAGLPEADSIAVAHAYMRSWIETRVVALRAAEVVDMDEIDRLVDDYRAELVMNRYRSAMAAQASDGIFAEDSLRAYYESNLNAFKLERPMLKGIYLKLPDDADKLAQIRRLYKSDKEADLDRLEKAAASEAIHYDYFRDNWIDIEQLETRIPADFETLKPQLAARRPVDVTSDGFVYLLSISDYLPAGATMPYEAARPLIRERMLAVKRLDYDRRLRESLFNSAVADGTVVFPNKNPLK